MSDLTSVQNRLDQHEREIALIGQSTRQMIDGQKQLTESLTDLTISLNKYIERHERSATDITDIKTEQKAHTAQIAAIREQNAANQDVINGVRGLNAKLVWFILVAILTPIISAGFIASRAGGG
jgi:septal ring factor EnvC (AmiA/AmiB activator)